MAAKAFEVEGIGTVHIYKRKGSRSLKLSIASDGKVRLSIPFWTTYAAGLQFARSRADWITTNAPDEAGVLEHGHRIGKAHRLVFLSGQVETPSSRLAGSEIRITRPASMLRTDPAVQAAATKASIRALRLQAAKLLPPRLRLLAEKYDFSYSDVQIKQLKGRWGSCDAQKHIVLNLFLMQLPWQLIDYVLLHELIHTKHLHHGPEFWDEFTRHLPHAKTLRKAIKNQKPVLMPVDTTPDVA